MEIIKSRKNQLAVHMKKLASGRAYRRECGEFLCQGRKLYDEAAAAGAEIRTVLCAVSEAENAPQGAVFAEREIIEYISPMKSAPEMLFTCAIPPARAVEPGRLILLENMQDPGNVGTVMRTARAFGMDGAVLLGECADPYNPKTVRATMGAVFTLAVYEPETAEELTVPIYAAALRDDAVSAERAVFPAQFALAIGNEGHGLSQDILTRAEKVIKIPMEPGSESLNAAVAASVLMWKIYTDKG